MYKSLLFLLLFVGINKHLRSNTNNEKLTPNIVSAPCNPIISLGTIPSGPFCAGNSFSVPYTFTDCVDAGNVFTVQLSNPIGLFTSPVNIGSISSVAAGNISVTIPINTVFGNGYRIRIVSSAPNAISADNGFNFTINPSPIANFNIVNSAQCVNGNNFQFQSTSTGTIASNAWSFGDGTTSLGSNPSKVYGNAGVYNVKLIVTGNNGCKDSMVKQTTVYPKPNVAFTLAQSCINSSIIQANNTTIASGTVNYFWDFGDLTTSTQTLPLKSYGTVGNQTIKLVATSNNGCKDSLTQNVNIALKPTASFTINNASQCVNGNNFNFTNTSTGAFSNQIWNLGNGVTSNNFNISNFNYASNGVYPVKLLLIGNSGCNDSVTQNVTVSPVPNFSINNATQCLTGNQFIFTNTSIGTLASSSWSFGDGNTASTTNAGNIYNSIGTYNVKLKVTEVGGCTDSITKTVQVIEKPNVGFSVSTANFCSGTNLQFNNTSSVGVGTLSYLWIFGDGNTSTQTNPLKSFSTAGTYQVKLVVTNNNGCKDSLTQNITILAKPVAAFTVNSSAQCIVGNQFNFINNSTGVISNYNWNFGDGNTSNVSNPSKSYALSGNYTVKLFANGTNGCVDSAIQTLSVNPKPNVAFSFSNTCLNTPIGLINNSSISNGTISYLWSFGDGTISNDLNPLKSYTTPGNYIIKLVATSNSGCKDSLSQTINILPKPVPAFSINNGAQCLQGNNFIFTNNSASTVSQIWSFGDGNTSTNLNATHTYSSAGVYIVKLVVTSANGCKDSISQSVTIDQKPTPSFLINNATQCLTGNSFVFTDNSAGLVATYAWSFGDGTTSNLQSPTHSYASTGTFPVKLVVSTALGCKDSITQNVQIVAKPTAAFVVNNNNQCVVGNSFGFTNNSTGASSYEWQFGDGGTSNTNNAIYTYSLAGTYTVKLIAISSTGCKDSVTNTVNVLIKPLAAFTVNNVTQCLSSNSFVLNNTSTSITNGYLWKFSDGTTSTQTNPTKAFSSVGAYTIKLIVTSDNGCKDSVTQNVSVLANPNPNFSVNNNTQCAGSNFIFTNTSGASSTYSWSFGEGTTSASTNPSFVYSIGGTYTVKLVSTHINGCKDSISQVVNVLARPSAIFGVNSLSQCLNGNNFITTNLSTGSIASYNWSFGDGTTSTLTNPTNIYSSVGNYLIKLVATGTNGCKDSLQQSISVVSKPNVAFTVNNAVQCITNNSFVFNNTTTGATSYSWIFGDGGVSTLLNPTKVYSTPNAYTVKLIATGNNGCKDSLTQNISVIAKPIPSFTINNAAQCVNENNFTFNNTSVGGNVYNWSFGDGTTSTLSNPTKVYTVANTYNLTLRVSNAAGCIDSVTTLVTVHPKPNIAFTVNGGTACLTNPSVSFINNSTGAINNTWYFGDGSSQIANNPTKVYPAVGTYNVKLVGSSNFSCKDSITQPITIGVKPQASFALNATTVCLGSSFVFTNTSTGAIASEFWDFGDGTVSSTPTPIKAYNTVGIYVVKLIVTGVNGCKDSLTQNLNVIVKPTVSFTINGGGSCLSTTNISITNTSTSASSYVWSFGDGNTSTLTNPNHTYATQGTYTVKLVATNANGCKDSVSQNVSIATKPVAAYTLNTTTQCAGGNNFLFTNTSTGNIATYLWDFGDGIFSNLTNPSKAYAVAGNYTVKLIVIGVNGCKDSVTQNVVVTTKPVPNFTIVGGGNCSNSLAISLTNTSTNASSYVWSFGDGTTNVLNNPTKTYAAFGSYTIKLIATNANGCVDSFSTTINLSTKPIASYLASKTSVCVGETVNFSNTSTVIGTGYHYWDFGNGIISTDSNTRVAFAAPGIYTIKYYITNSSACKDSLFTSITVTNKPIASFTTPNALCTGSNNITFTNTSTGATNYTWSFGDGSFSTLASPTKTYASFGTYTVKLIASNASGCIDSVSQIISLSSKPTASFTVNSLSQCLDNNRFSFTNNSTAELGAVYYWTFGDGTVSQDVNPIKLYSLPGVYTVRLFVTNPNGCKDSTQNTVTVVTKPIASFTTPNGLCTGSNNIAFTNTSTGATNYTWSFGDGSFSTLASPTKTYASFGTYTVKLIASNASGCIDSVSQIISLSSKPTASFTVNSLSQCLDNNRFSFTNNSTAVLGAVYYWTFGDGTVSQDVNPIKLYSLPGVYTVRLFVTNPNGCKDSTLNTVTVVNKPTASFTVPSNVCTSNNTFTFTNTSVGASSYTWSFGDGTISNQASPTKVYPVLGTYTVRLIAVNINGCVDSTSQIVSMNGKPIASFNVISTTGNCAGTSSFTMSNTSSNLVSPTYFWQFGNGSTDVVANPSVNYSTPGFYTVRLSVTNSNGCVDTAIQFVTVAAKPTVGFTVNKASQCLNNNSFVFTPSVSNPAIASYLWSFGDGTTSLASNPIKSFSTINSFTVKLIARTASGCIDSAIQVVSVNPPVQANFNASIDLCTSAVSFNNTSTGTSTGFPFTWLFGDGSTSQVASPIKQYATPGSYNVTLYAKNNFCVDSITRVIFVPQTVSAKFSINDTTQCVGSNIFRYSVTNPIPGNTYLWDFGDTTYSTLVNVSKVYTRGANYAVKLIVTNINGCKDSSIVNIQVAPKPTASFIYTSNYICAGNNIQFVNTSNIAGLTYTWIFGDGTFSNDVSPFKSFANGGVYTVKLLAANSFGCKDSSFVNVLVNEPPKPIIVASALNRCSNTYNFSNSNPGSTPLNYSWNFGDGTTAVLPSLQKAYTTSTSMVVNVVLTVTDTFGCTAVATTPISLLQKPSVSFTVNAVQQCVNSNSFVLNNTTTGAVTGTTFLWIFGDGTSSSLANPTKSYTNPGEYNIRLIALQANGCRDSVITTVKVNPLPGARISGIATICSGSSANIGIKFFGTAPFNVTYTDGTANFALNNILTDTISIPVNPSRSASYRIVQMSDGGSCPISLTQITGTALITVVPATLITRQPTDTGACLAGNTRLYVNVISGPSPSFQWMKNGLDIVGQTDSILRFNNLQPSDVANYSVRVTSACGVLISNIANVSIGIAPAAPITTNKFVCRNSTPVPLTAIGSNLIWYNAAIGGVASSIAPSPLTNVPGSQIFFVSSNSNFCESSRSSIIVTVIDSPRVVLNVSPSSSLLPGQVATITATITPSTLVPSNYFWSKNGVNTVIGTNTISVPFSEIGTYRVNVIFPTTCNVTSDTIRISQRLGFSRAISEKRIFIVPNPVKDVAALYFDSPINEVITVRLIDGFGRIRSAQTLNYLAAFQKVDLNVRNLVPGYYAVEVMNSKGVSIARDILFKYSR